MAGILTVVAFCGCAKPPYELAPVQGVVTLDGEPLSGAVVNFQPIATAGTDVGPGSTGRCNEQGEFKMKTIHGEVGAVVCEHRVRIYSHSPESPSVSDEDAPDQPQERVPLEFNYKSKLRFTVPSGGADVATFDLKS